MKLAYLRLATSLLVQGWALNMQIDMLHITFSETDMFEFFL